MAPDTAAADSLRLDKWLWAARFFKTRSLAAAAIDAGHVRHNGHPTKPAREVRPGDVLELTLGAARWTVVIQQISPQRRPFNEARHLYAETDESQARRAAAQEAKRLAPVPGSERGERPSKKDRRLIHRFRDGY